MKPKKMPVTLENWLRAVAAEDAYAPGYDAKEARTILAALEYERQRAAEWAKTANEATQSVLRLTRPIRTGMDCTPDEQRAETEAVIPKPRKPPEIEASYARERNIARRKKLTAP